MQKAIWMDWRILLGIDFGENFGRLQTLQFGYNFYYFNKGLQILEL